jgi:hypothetical protein
MILLLAAISFFQGLVLWAHYYLSQEAGDAHQP